MKLMIYIYYKWWIEFKNHYEALAIISFNLTCENPTKFDTYLPPINKNTAGMLETLLFNNLYGNIRKYPTFNFRGNSGSASSTLTHARTHLPLFLCAASSNFGFNYLHGPHLFYNS